MWREVWDWWGFDWLSRFLWVSFHIFAVFLCILTCLILLRANIGVQPLTRRAHESRFRIHWTQPGFFFLQSPVLSVWLVLCFRLFFCVSLTPDSACASAGNPFGPPPGLPLADDAPGARWGVGPQQRGPADRRRDPPPPHLLPGSRTGRLEKQRHAPRLAEHQVSLRLCLNTSLVCGKLKPL